MSNKQQKPDTITKNYVQGLAFLAGLFTFGSLGPVIWLLQGVMYRKGVIDNDDDRKWAYRGGMAALVTIGWNILRVLL